MPGLLDFLQTPAGQGLLAATFTAAGNAGRGGPLNTLGKAGMNGLLGYTGAQQNAQDAELRGMQVQNMKSEISQRDAAIKKQEALAQYTQKFLQGGGSVPASQGQLGSGSFGVMPTAAGQPDIPAPRPSGLGGKSLEEVTAFHMMGGPDLTNAWKLAREGFERKPGSFYEGVNGQREYVADPSKGFTFQNGRVGVLPGFTDAQAGITLATEAPKALLNSAGRVNLRANADGTQTPISELSENPTLQNILGGVLGRQPVPAQASPVQPAPQPAPRTAPAAPAQPQISPVAMRPEAGVQGSFRGNPEEVSASIAGIRDPQERANAQAAFEEQMRRSNGQLPKYGKTTAQETNEAAGKEAAILQVKDIGEQRKAIMGAGFNAPTNIAKYQQIGKLLSDVDGGKWTAAGTEFSSALNGLGIKIDKNLPNKEAAASLANQAALELRSPAGGAGMPGAMSDSDRAFLSNMTPNMSQSAEGRKKVIDAYVSVQQRNQQVAQFARNYENKHGRLDNGFFDQLQAWSSSNPLFKGK